MSNTEEPILRKESDFIRRIDALSEAAYRLLMAWENLQEVNYDDYMFSKDYAFHYSFDEMCAEISQWRLTVYHEIKQIRERRMNQNANTSVN